MTASPQELHLCLPAASDTTCQHVSHMLRSCVRSKGWGDVAPKPIFGTYETVEMHGLKVP